MLSFVALGVVVPGIPFLGLGGRWHVLGFGAWWSLAALAAALALAIAAASSRRRSDHRLLAALSVVALSATAVFGAALTVASVAAHPEGTEPRYLTLAALAPLTLPTGAGANATETYAHTLENGDPLLVDIYRPSGIASGASVVLYLHGGGWILHDRTLHGEWLRALADEGIVVLSADYTLATADRATWQSAADEVACALVWAAANAERFGGDPRRIVIAGDSAGGGLALSAAYRAARGAAKDECAESSDGATVPIPAGVAGIVPVVDVGEFWANPELSMGRYSRTMVERYLGGSPAQHPDRVAAVDPTTYLTADAPPTLLVTVEHDHLVPAGGARMLAAAATTIGVPVTRVEVPFADHGLLARAEGLGALIARDALVSFIAGLEPAVAPPR